VLYPIDDISATCSTDCHVFDRLQRVRPTATCSTEQRGELQAAHAADVELKAFVSIVTKAAPRASEAGKVSLKWLFGMTRSEVLADYLAEQEAVSAYEAGNRC
jgi:hypothetical protein